jgi:predicted class III extradiol MEMO1 family dioxygenase
VIFHSGESLCFLQYQKTATRHQYERKQIRFLKRMDMDTEAFAKLTKKKSTACGEANISLLLENTQRIKNAQHY